MTDYFCQVHGLLPNGEAWSTGRHITSGRTLAVMLTAWAGAWDAAWTDAAHGLNAAYPAAMTVTSYSVAQLDASMREVAKQTSAAAHVGTDAAEAVPETSSVILSWRSSVDVRKTARGHQSLPGPSNDQVLNDKLTAGAQTRFSNAINAIKTTITADGSTFFLFPPHTTSTGIPAFTKTVVDTVTCRDKLGIQKRRYRKEPATYV